MNAGQRWTRKNRRTGTMVSLYNAREAELDDSWDANWYLVCEDHNRFMTFATRSMAEHHGTAPVIEFCDECREAYWRQHHTEESKA